MFHKTMPVDPSPYPSILSKFLMTGTKMELLMLNVQAVGLSGGSARGTLFSSEMNTL